MFPATIVESWSSFLSGRGSRVEMTVSAISLGLVLFAIARILPIVESRPGAALSDPLLAFAGPFDVTWPIFIVLYTTILSSAFVLLHYPLLFVQGMRAFALVMLFRMACMIALPLDPPSTMIPLNDPIIQLAGGATEAFTRDLFFSGHTATMVLLALLMPTTLLRRIVGLLAVCVAVGVLIQHVHYSVDVLVAPFASFTAWVLSGVGLRGRSASHVTH